MAAQRVEINLRIPQVKEPVTDASGYPINNHDVRFIKRMEVDALPRPGERIQLTASGDSPFLGTVVRTDWDDSKEMFVVSCQYTLKSISRPLYLALMEGADWTRKPLLQT